MKSRLTPSPLSKPHHQWTTQVRRTQLQCSFYLLDVNNANNICFFSGYTETPLTALDSIAHPLTSPTMQEQRKCS